MSTWHEFYRSDLQSLWSLLVVPFGFLVYRFVRALSPRGEQARPRSASARFLETYALVWSVETLLDPIVGGPVVGALGLRDGFGATVAMFAFVLLGDLRVFVLLFGTGAPGAPWLARAFGYALVVPLATGALYGGARALHPSLPGQTMWLIYELGFLAMTVWLARFEVRRAAGSDRELEAFLRSALGYVASYYALWAACDVAILLGVDEGWALRSVPNQLYYALWVPFVYARSAAMRAR